MRAHETRLVDLRALRWAYLAPVVEAQVDYWRSRFSWDLAPAMGAVRQLLARRALVGYAAISAGRPAGYCYFMPRGRTATVGDLFVLRDSEVRGRIEQLLLEGTVNAAALQPGVERVQGQLLFLRALPSLRFALLGTLRTFSRELMLINDLGSASGRSPGHVGLQLSSWSGGDRDAAAELIAAAYRGHVDSLVNELYGSVEGARGLLRRLTARTGPARFFPPASVVARGPGEASLAGMTMGSMVGDRVGHVLQLCVSPAAQGRGLGSELLRRSLSAFSSAGCEAVSLTVTRSNRKALEFYERRGFASIASYPAFVWERL